MPRNDGQEMLELEPRNHQGAPTAGEGIPNVPYVRLTQRTPPPRERRSMWLLLALVVAGHLLLAWLAYLVLRPQPYRRNENGVIAVTLIEPKPSLPAPPPLLPPPPLPKQPAPAAPPRPVHREPPAQGAIQATLEGEKGEPLKLYNSNGQIRLPSNVSSTPAPAYSAPPLTGSQIYSGKSPVPYKPTRFNQDWAPDKESLGAKTVGRAVDKVIEKTTVQKTVKLPGGMKVHCVLSPLALIAGCVPPPPPPPPKNDNDIRLSMPPAETLTGKKVVVPSSASSAGVPAPASSG